MSRKGAAVAASASVLNYYTHKLPKIASLLSVTSIDSKFCAFDGLSASTRYMIQWLGSSEAKLSNPDAKLSTTVLNDNSEPIISVVYKDGTKLNLKGKHLRFDEMQSFFIKHTEPKNLAVKIALEEEQLKSSGKLKKFTR